MEKLLLISCVLLFLLSFSKHNVQSLTRYEDHHLELMLQTTLSLQRTALFYQRNYHKVNLDGVFGIRIAEGILSNVLKQHFDEVVRYPRVYSLLERAYQEVHEGGLKAVRQLDGEGSSYYKMFRSILAERVWYYEPPIQHSFNQSLVFPVSEGDEEFNEEVSDDCMTHLLGSQKVGVQNKCVFTDTCWRLVTKMGGSGYTITHQALYFVVADVAGCGPKLKQERHIDVYTHLYPSLGSNIYSQMKYNIKSKDANGDLFLEQGLLSHWMGVDPFTDNIDWIDMVLKWQDESGCVKNEDTKGENGDGLRGDPSVGRSKGPERRLQYELVLDDGCSSHITSLYIAYLSLALQWLIRHSPRAATSAPGVYSEVKMLAGLGIFLMALLVLIFLKLYGRRFMSLFMRLFRYRKVI